MKKIGFIDYFLDEWHANNYPAWIADERCGGRYKVGYAWAETDKPGGLSTSEWCEKFGVERAETQQELIDKSDCIVVLSPDNPERHEALAAPALKSGKPVYVDKTFALSRAEAERMFALAQANGTPMYSTSALRYASELGWLKDNGYAQDEIELISARGPGKFSNYSIHQLEMVVAAMGPGTGSVIASGTAQAPVLLYEYFDGRCAIVNHLPWAGFSLALQAKDGGGTVLNIESNFWNGFVDALLTFFDTGKPSVPVAETLAAVSMVEAGIKALDRPGEKIKF